ncbi:MAG: hypothetical protein BJ554DRAFT_198, partial [Olpidium bornovanus]
LTAVSENGDDFYAIEIDRASPTGFARHLFRFPVQPILIPSLLIRPCVDPVACTDTLADARVASCVLLFLSCRLRSAQLVGPFISKLRAYIASCLPTPPRLLTLVDACTEKKMMEFLVHRHTDICPSRLVLYTIFFVPLTMRVNR